MRAKSVAANCSKFLSWDFKLRPSCDLKMLESWEDRRLIVRLVAEVVGDRVRSWTIVDDRASKISRSKLFKTSELGLQVKT